MKSPRFSQAAVSAKAHMDALKALRVDMQREILLSAVKASVVPLEVAVKRYAARSEDTGALRASITNKVTASKKTARIVGLVGPDRKARYIGRKKAGKLGLAIFGGAKPSRYAHLVEKGHVAKNGRWVAPRPFIRPAVMTTLGAQEAAMSAAVARGLEKTLKKFNAATAA